MSGKSSGNTKKLGILLSGRGSNFLALHAAIADGRLAGAEIVLVLSNDPEAPGLVAARQLGIPTGVANQKKMALRDAALIALLHAAEVELVCLAGYMRIVSPAFVAAFPGAILNIHPSLLPAFPGLEAPAQALAYGARVAGCTVHFVDEQVDHGAIVLQRAVPVLDHDTVATLSARILVEEHQAYPEAVARVLGGEYTLKGRIYRRATPDESEGA